MLFKSLLPSDLFTLTYVKNDIGLMTILTRKTSHLAARQLSVSHEITCAAAINNLV